MRYYLGVDWADQTHAVWVVDESGRKITARTVSHTAEGLGEWGRELDEWRAEGYRRFFREYAGGAVGPDTPDR